MPTDPGTTISSLYQREHFKIDTDSGLHRVTIEGPNAGGTAINRAQVDDTGALKVTGSGGGGGGTVDQGTGGSSPWLVKIDQTGTNNDVNISGTVDVSGSTVTIQEPLSVDDNGSSLTVDQSAAPWVVEGQVNADSPTSGKPIIIGGVASTAAPSPVSADGDAVDAWFTRTGVLQVGDGLGSLTIDTAGGSISVDDGGGSLTVDGTVDTELAAASALSDTFSNPTTAPVGACELYWDGTQWVRHRLSFSQTRNTVASGAGTAVDMSSNPMASFGIFVIKDGGTTLTGFTVLLEGSLDNANWTTLVSNSSVSGNPQLVWVASKPVFYMRSNATAVNGTGSPTVKIVILAKEI